MDTTLQRDSYNQGYRAQFALFTLMYAISLMLFFVSASDESGALRGYVYALNPQKTIAAYAVCLLAVVQFYFPRQVGVLLFLVLAHLWYSWQILPSVNNHNMMEIFLNVAIVCVVVGMMITRKSFVLDGAAVFAQIAPLGRMLLIIMYFYGTFHKINTDFLDPTVSCAVRMWQGLSYLPDGLKESLWIRYTVIYGTLVIEGLAMIFLCFPRLKYYGMVMGCLFHALLATVGDEEHAFIVGSAANMFVRTYSSHGGLANFSFFAITLHFFFLSPDAFERIQHTHWVQSLKSKGYYSAVVRYVVPTVILAAMLFYASQWWMAGRIIVWMVLGGAFVLFLIVYGNNPQERFGRDYFISQSSVLNGIVVLFFINGLCPYIGLKTESSIAMFSNLHTEGNITNHLLFTKPPYLFDYQKRENLVQVIETSDDYVYSRFVGPYIYMPYFELRNWFSQHPNNSVEYLQQGKMHMVPNVRNDPELSRPYPLWLRKWMDFKPVNYNRPKPCSH